MRPLPDIDPTQQKLKRHHSQMYNRYPITLVAGRGSGVRDAAGREYVDALGGIAVNALGHAHPEAVAAITEQAGQLIHVSNLYYFPSQASLALAPLLRRVAGCDVSLLFTPHLLPVDRGIRVTCYAEPVGALDATAVRAAYAEDYGDETFVRLLDSSPAIKQVRGWPKTTGLLQGPLTP